MPSNLRAQEAMLSMVPPNAGAHFIELGSGWGQLAYRIAQAYPTKKVVGYERSMIPYVFSRMVYRAPNLQFQYRDFLQTEFAENSVLFCYLYPKGMQLLQQHLRESRVWVISHCFAFANIQPIHKRHLSDIYHTPIYFYRVEAS